MANIVLESFSEEAAFELTQEWGEGAIWEKIRGQDIKMEEIARANREKLDELGVL